MDRAQLEALAPETAYDARMMTGTAVRQQIERAELEHMAESAFDAFNTFVEALDPEAAEWIGGDIAEAEALLSAWT